MRTDSFLFGKKVLRYLWEAGASEYGDNILFSLGKKIVKMHTDTFFVFEQREYSAQLVEQNGNRVCTYI